MNDSIPSTTLKALETQRSVLLELQVNGQSTIEEMAKALDVNYYTARKAIYDLFQQHKIKVVTVEGRKRVYGLSDSQRLKDTIPYISNILTRTQHKVIDLLAAVGHEDEMQAVGAVKAMPKSIVDLMELANRAGHGFPVGNELDALRVKMQEHYLILSNAAKVYEQILQDPRFWQESELKQFVDDPDYHYPDIIKAVEYYA